MLKFNEIVIDVNNTIENKNEKKEKEVNIYYQKNNIN
jgi:hypothetical protein